MNQFSVHKLFNEQRSLNFEWSLIYMVFIDDDLKFEPHLNLTANFVSIIKHPIGGMFVDLLC